MARLKSTTATKTFDLDPESVMGRLKRQANELDRLGYKTEPLLVTEQDMEEVIGWALDHYSNREEIRQCNNIGQIIEDMRNCFRSRTAGVFEHPLEIVQ